MIDNESPSRSSGMKEREKEVGLSNSKDIDWDVDIGCEEMKQQEEVKMTSRFLAGVTQFTIIGYIG